MSGHRAFENLKNFLNETPIAYDKFLISEERFQEWKRQYTFDGLCGIRYGQSFCNHFGITDNLLYYSLTPEQTDTYIREKYIERT